MEERSFLTSPAILHARHYEEIDGDFLKKRASAEVEAFIFPGGHVLPPADVATKAARWVHETKEF